LIGAAMAMALGLLLAVAAPADPPSLTVTATDAVVGGAIHATAELSESPKASGTISFEVFGPGDETCSGPALTPAPASASVTGEGQYASGEITPPTAGAYYWSAHYEGEPPGDPENPPADSNCLAISSVGKASPELTGDASTGAVGTAIHDEVTIAGGFSPTGGVTFSVYGPTDTDCSTTPLATSAAPIQGNHATSADFLAQQAGEFRWTLEYEGDTNNEAAVLGCGANNQASSVDKASPTLVGVATSAVKVGLPISDSVTLANSFGAGGQLVFRAYGPGDQTCAGAAKKYEATVAVSGNGTYVPPGFSPAPGLYRWTVEYEGDANNDAAVLDCGAANQASVVNKASPTLSGVATSAVKVGLKITDSVTLAEGFGVGDELVFRAYGPGNQTCAGAAKKYEATVAVNGNGTYAPPGFAPAPGLYRWTVEYAGDANNDSAALGCGAANQASSVNKASPTLVGVATSAIKVGLSITDSVTLAEGFEAGGQLVFRAYGPGDQTCATTAKYEEAVPVSGNGTYAPPGFVPAPGLYRWTVEYEGDGNNDAAVLGCGAANQASAVGTIPVSMAVGATGGTVGNPVHVTATIQEGAIPTGQITFKAFSPTDTTCSGAAAFSSTASVSGNGQYRSTDFVPSRVGTFRWTVGYSGDVNHIPATAGCGKATSSVTQAGPSIAGAVKQRITVGTSFQDTATLQGGFSPTGTITFQIYGPVAAGCAKPAFVDTVAIAGNGTFSSDPFVPQRPGRYSFVAGYSGDSANKKATEPCDSAGQVVEVQKRMPKVKPHARLMGGKRISIRALLSGGFSPAGTVTFRLYGPGNKHCRHKPTFSGGVTVKSNGNVSLAQYLATKSGLYRLSVGYSGDQRNRRYKGSCSGAQSIRID
jgi:hypothetical protein